ncbi:acyltransferase [Pseudomonas sp. UBA6562]|uniref:acyltransferase n=1 Tax=Pseudomonas sp. UBA6562 TaxID=1947332 RepID=UPI0025DF737F|nr:acyltransferase family protein [Pseudomonas sp. UBA6562]
MSTSIATPSFSAAPAPAPSKAHDVSLDVLRLVATFMVILIHVSAAGFSQKAQHWWGVNAYESLSRASVPVFFMITGALLLPRAHSIAGVLRRVWRMALALGVWSLAYLVYNKYKVTGLWLPDFSELGHWCMAILRWPVAGHLWYLYTLIAAYFFIPVLAGFFRTTPVRLQCLVLGVWLLAASLVPFAERLFGEARVYVDTRFFYIYPAYLLAGALLYHHLAMRRVWLLASVVGYLLCTAGTATLTWYFSKDAAVNTELYYEYFAPMVVVAAACVFHGVRAAGARFVERYPNAQGPLVFFGNLTFGIYLMHPMVIWELHHAGMPWNFINPWLAIPLVMATVFIICASLTYAIKRIPILRAALPG